MDAHTEEAENGRPSRDLCDLCGFALAGQSGVLALVADSSAVDDHTPTRDGQRLVVACSPEHLAVLEEVYQRRTFNEEELWAAQIARALRYRAGRITPEELSERTGLTFGQVVRAITWRNDIARAEGPSEAEEGQPSPDIEA
ncbi:hypothetical protein GCM10009837_42280 [Streptomyces durmitorensis]|uniref:Uncharacterized protein n=1 Tax=Streptomyces durmitorensis TaxID=319947 RepID=A0ABY4Q5T4_9ACTN|nr:hypothetical protein [Streptomyces durmitorensis]UQT60745.1 hypothetical protein M4V62_39905 [Streptomyces durmitorensis]